MPKKAALKFHDVQEAIDWATKPPPEQAGIHQDVGKAIMMFGFSRPNYGIRESYLEGVRLFEKAAGKANELAFELEVQYLRARENPLPIDESRIDALAKALFALAQKCHRWSPDESAGMYLDNYLGLIPPLDDDLQPIQSDRNLRGLTGRDLYVARLTTAWKQEGLSRSDFLHVPPGKDVRFPTWWASDPKRMRIAAINMRRAASKFQVFANQARRSSGGRPQDGDKIQLIASARAHGINIPALSFLMAAFAVKPSWPSNTPIPPSLLAMRHGGRPAGILSKAERTWLETSQRRWFTRLKEAPRDKRRKRKKDAEAIRRLMSEQPCQNDRP